MPLLKLDSGSDVKRWVLVTTSDWLKKNNPDGIVDAVFALLADPLPSDGIGKFDPTKTHCLQKYVADVAFSNAAAAKDREGAEAAIKFAALERNANAVGEASKECAEGEIKIVNPEISGISRHQDGASMGADEINKNSTLAVARALKLIDADPLTATEVGTFKKGDPKDPTARGFSCNDSKITGKGCIFEEDRLVIDATPEEIAAAVADIQCNPVWCKGSQPVPDKSAEEPKA
ncbi:hypothetical protein CROQUDRAFT_133619 [Cronartium quercuum f. sp. fusiforme G11]|uniref:Uncharacterized protein n=1 Tax=Cronartium quercuum f. sp. fusiforme G11 TaxID=708437 RepID=A0A9P6NL76_9BASI|nr:hypothetical protein CROQUDRAFT_133619 [Cronartium quercuum f. sp. fusiforme G11]